MNKKNSKIIQGIALLLMIYHHQFSYYFPHSSLIFGNVFFIEEKIAWFGKICVALFAFVSGYGIMCSYRGGDDSREYFVFMYKKIGKRILNLLLVYWTVLVVATPFFVLKCNFALRDILLAATTYDTSINGGWWYIRQYIFMLLLSPCIIMILTTIRKKLYFRSILPLIVFSFIFMVLHFGLGIGSTSYLLIYIEGMLCCYLNLFEKITKSISRPKIVSCLLLLLIIIARVKLSNSAGDSWMDIVIAPLFVLLIDVLIPNSTVLEDLGKKSIWFWLLSTSIQVIFEPNMVFLRFSEVIIIFVYGATFVSGNLLMWLFSNIAKSRTN